MQETPKAVVEFQGMMPPSNIAAVGCETAEALRQHMNPSWTVCYKPPRRHRWRAQMICAGLSRRQVRYKAALLREYQRMPLQWGPANWDVKRVGRLFYIKTRIAL